MKLAKIFAALLVIGCMATSAWADVNGTDTNVRVAPNAKGDFLIFPFYGAADGGLQTNLKVVNTSKDTSSVAKIVVRSNKYSKELLDFFVYLSPADVWTGTLKYDADADDVVMYSEDDSVQSETGVWADSESPLNQPLSDEEMTLAADAGDFKDFGYINVINAATVNATDWDNNGKYDTGKDFTKKIDKTYIEEYFSELLSNLEDVDGNSANPQNVLSGWMSFALDGMWTSGLQAFTLADYDQEVLAATGKDTVLGLESATTTAQLEAVMAKDNVVMPFENNNAANSLHFFNFPTKYSNLPAELSGDVTSGGHKVRGTDETYPVSPFFKQNAGAVSYSDDLSDLCVQYSGRTYDNMEEMADDPEQIFSPYTNPSAYMCREMDWVAANAFPFEEGVVHYNFEKKESVNPADVGTVANATTGDDIGGYKGAPVIPFVLDFGAEGFSMSYASWDDSAVTNENGDAMPLYQYTGVNTNPVE